MSEQPNKRAKGAPNKIMQGARAVVQMNVTVEVPIGRMLDSDSMETVLRAVHELAFQRIKSIQGGLGRGVKFGTPSLTRIVLDGDLSVLED